MKMCPTEEEQRTTIVGGRKLKKDKTLKVRMDALDILELDRICNKLGFAERATVLRHLVHHYKDIEQSEMIVALYHKRVKAIAEFEGVIESAVRK